MDTTCSRNEQLGRGADARFPFGSGLTVDTLVFLLHGQSFRLYSAILEAYDMSRPMIWGLIVVVWLHSKSD